VFAAIAVIAVTAAVRLLQLFLDVGQMLVKRRVFSGRTRPSHVERVFAVMVALPLLSAIVIVDDFVIESVNYIGVGNFILF
jgi:hypothetical protein